MFKVFKNGKMPTRGSKYSAAVDLYASHDIAIGVGETVMVGLGVCIDEEELANTAERSFGQFIDLEQCTRVVSDFKSQHYLQLMLRSSLGKKGLIIPNGVGVIDLDFLPHCKIGKHLNNGVCDGFKHKNNEVCHHIDRNKKNNDIENLQLMTDSEHARLHSKEDRERSLKAGTTRSKFTVKEASEIISEYNLGGITQAELAHKYCCGQTLITNIINKKRYCYGK